MLNETSMLLLLWLLWLLLLLLLLWRRAPWAGRHLLLQQTHLLGKGGVLLLLWLLVLLLWRRAPWAGRQLLLQLGNLLGKRGQLLQFTGDAPWLTAACCLMSGTTYLLQLSTRGRCHRAEAHLAPDD